MANLMLTTTLPKFRLVGAATLRSRQWSPRLFVTAAPRPLQSGKQEEDRCAGDKAVETVQQGAKVVSRAGEEAKDKAGSLAGQATDKTKEGANQASEAAQDFTEKAKQTAQDAWGKAKETSENIRDKVAGKAEETKDSVKESAKRSMK